jgi:hypothetical protein
MTANNPLERAGQALALALLALCMSACGGASTGGASSRKQSALPAAAAGMLDGDGDDDTPGSTPPDSDGDARPSYGPPADAADRRAIVALLRGFYAAAAAGDGVRGCAMLLALVAETVVEEHDHGKGPRSLRGNTCPRVAAKLFRQRHRELAAEAAALRVPIVQMRFGKAWAVLNFGGAKEYVEIVRREGGAWKLDGLLDAAPF